MPEDAMAATADTPAHHPLQAKPPTACDEDGDVVLKAAEQHAVASVWRVPRDTQHSDLRFVHALDARAAWLKQRAAHQRQGGVQFAQGVDAHAAAWAPEDDRVKNVQELHTACEAWGGVCGETRADGADVPPKLPPHTLQTRVNECIVAVHPYAAAYAERAAPMPALHAAEWLREWCDGVAPYGAVGAAHKDPPQCGVLCFHNRDKYTNAWSEGVRVALLRPSGGTLATNGARLVQLPAHKWSVAGSLLHDYASKSGYTGAYTQHVADMLCSATAAYRVPPVRFGVNTLSAALQWSSAAACPFPELAHPLFTRGDGQRPPLVSFTTHHQRCTDWLFPSPLAWELATQRYVASALPASTWVDPVTYMSNAAAMQWSGRRDVAWARLRMGGSPVDAAAHQLTRLHGVCERRGDCLSVSWEHAARRLHALRDPGTGAVTAHLAHRTPAADAFARAAPREVQRHALAHKYRVSVCGDGGDSHAVAAVLSGSVVVCVDAPPSCAAPHVWGMDAFDGPYLRRTSPVSDVHEDATLVRVHADLRNLVETVEWLQEHDDVARSIAERCAAKAARVFTESNMAWYCASVMQYIAV